MFKDLRNTIYDKNLKITIVQNKVNILNYEEILIFESDKVLVKTNKNIIKIIGEDLSITKLERNEVLIEGKIKQIDLGD